LASSTSDRTARRVQIASAALILAVGAFGYGVAVAHYEIWPFALIQDSSYAVGSLVRAGEIVPRGRRVEPPVGAPREPFTVHDPARIGDGLFVVLGSDDSTHAYAAWAYDTAGRKLHTWHIDYKALDPSGPSSGTDMPHAFQVLPDGSAIVAFDGGDVMARIDECSRPVWIRDGIYHHSMTVADDGSVWVWRAEGSHYAQYHYLLNFDAHTGATIREIGLIEDIIQRLGANAFVFGVHSDYPFRHVATDPEDRASDLFHPNDVDVLSAELAPRFPMFEAGDLLLSFREIDLVAVVDPDTAEPKWWNVGPWIKQHDPDFLPDGRISVYSNNTGRGRSEILTIDPKTRAVTSDLSGGAVRFYSAEMGSHQYLPNGNVLITVPGEGRVLLVSERGDLIMEFNNVSSQSAGQNEHVENAAWFPPGYFGSTPKCADPS
jgi:arylsulfotransferase ASST